MPALRFTVVKKKKKQKKNPARCTQLLQFLRNGTAQPIAPHANHALCAERGNSIKSHHLYHPVVK